MTITFNNRIEEVSGSLSLEEFAEKKNIPTRGTAIAVNGVLVPSSQWAGCQLKDKDDVIVVSAAYGG